MKGEKFFSWYVKFNKKLFWFINDRKTYLKNIVTKFYLGISVILDMLGLLILGQAFWNNKKSWLAIIVIIHIGLIIIGTTIERVQDLVKK